MMELQVNDMTCGHCSSAVTQAVKRVDAQASVDIDMATKTVRIESTQPSDAFVAAIEDAGYQALVRA
ncbi:copper chaperone [Trinickia fusca]|uniref:Copper chaperone n=2 Tax=Trinickia fusca TaxID=2419777 RepID=A0A494WYJ7_9BURK|nr:copper chaperone [Trinickia fusca]